MNHLPKREKTPPLLTSQTSSKLKQTKQLEASPSSKKPEKQEVKINPPSSATKQPTLTKTKTVGNLKTTQSTTVNSVNTQSRVSKEEVQKSKLSLKIEPSHKEEAPIITPKTTKNTSGGLNLSIKEIPKLERNPTSKSILPISKTEIPKSTSVASSRKTIVKTPTTKGPIVKQMLEDKSNTEEAKKDIIKSIY